LAAENALGAAGGGVPRELSELADGLGGSAGVGRGRGGHDRWLQVALTGNVRIFELPEYICAPLIGGL